MKIKSIRRAEWAVLLVFISIVLGAFMRFNPSLIAGFPVGDGGMFAVMVEDLEASHYALPEFTTYNHSMIPFAYPPLGFYAGRVAADLFGLTAIEVLRWVPALFASLSIPAFYLLASRIAKSKYEAAISTLFFALMPRALSWFVLGGGLTRSPAQFFMLLALATVVRLYKENRRSDIFWAGVFAGLTIMSHPEAAVHMIASVVLLWLLLARSRPTFLNLVGVGIVALITSIPWWATVISYHGIDPILRAAQTGQKSLAVLNLVSFNFTEEIYATLIAVLGLLGLGHRLVHKDYLLPIWLVVPFLVEGRSAVLPAAIPLALLAARGFIDVVLPAFLSGAGKGTEESDELSSVEFGLFVYLLLFLVFSTYQFGLQAAGNTLASTDRQAMNWIRDHTSGDSKFLVLTGTNAITCDWVLEWFPALTDRQSIYTVQGTEWTKGANFASYVRSTYAVQRCLTDSDLSCLDSAVNRLNYDYVYVSKMPSLDCRRLPFPHAFDYFLDSMRADPGFQIVYETDEVIIFNK
jgi:Dolichyl-phosphate-mannose-protein mannosyltransferase